MKYQKNDGENLPLASYICGYNNITKWSFICSFVPEKKTLVGERGCECKTFLKQPADFDYLDDETTEVSVFVVVYRTDCRACLLHQNAFRILNIQI